MRTELFWLRPVLFITLLPFSSKYVLHYLLCDNGAGPCKHSTLATNRAFRFFSREWGLKRRCRRKGFLFLVKVTFNLFFLFFSWSHWHIWGDAVMFTPIKFYPHLHGLQVKLQNLMGKLPMSLTGTPAVGFPHWACLHPRGLSAACHAQLQFLASHTPATRKGVSCLPLQAVVSCPPALIQQQWTSSGPEQPRPRTTTP